MAAGYLALGPRALWEDLADRSLLRRLGEAAALDELAVRGGPAEGARWELRTPEDDRPGRPILFSVELASGIDDVLAFEIVDEADGPRLLSVRSLAETARAKPGTAPVVAPALPPRRVPLNFWLALTGFAAAAVAFAMAVVSRREPLPAAALAIAGLLAAGMGLVISRVESARKPAAGGPGRVAPRLASLAPLRRLLDGDSGRDLAALRAALPRDEPAASVGRLWIAQAALARGSLTEARDLLRNAPPTGWTEALRGRVAFAANDLVDAALRYERAAASPDVHDGLFLEAAEVLSLLGFDSQVAPYLKRLDLLGTRSADARLLLADAALKARQLDVSEGAFRAAWALRPLERRDLFGLGELWEVLRRPDVYKMLALGSPVEPVVTPPPATAPIALPEGASATLCGALLRIEARGGELFVPFGASIAPAGTPVEDAGARSRAEDVKALASVGDLVREPPPAGALGRPSVRQRVERAARALAERHRWPEVVALTSALDGHDERVPPGLVLYRAEALRRTDAAPAARLLLAEVSRNPAFSSRGRPGTLYQLAELYAAFEEIDRAVRLLERVEAMRPADFLRDRIRQLRTEQRLAATFATHRSEHFEMLTPPDRRDGFAARAASIFEAERTRMKRWIPAASERPVKIHILSWEEFRSTYATGFDILGLYDGKIRVPLGGVPAFVPPVVEVMTHELAHALLADASDDRAPHWFQEGVAQHLEMRRHRPNHLGYHREKGELLAFDSLEGILTEMPDAELVGLAYHQSAWLVWFIESRYGRESIARLTAAYRAGRTTDEAILGALLRSSSQVFADFADWCADAPKMVTREDIVVYEKGSIPGYDE